MSSKKTQAFHHYGDEFNTDSAEVLLPYILGLVKVESVLDLGCGTGTWLKVFQENGVSYLLGLDGEHVEAAKGSNGVKQFLLDEEHFKAIDFEQKSCFDHVIDKKYDLALCLEVMEHLSPEAGKRAVKFLAKSSDVIVFSAAIPHQTGENHVNEQFPDYWQKLFEKEDFTFYDAFRTKFWNDSTIEWWYRQNLFLVVKNGVKLKENLPLFEGDARIHPKMLDIYLHLLKEIKVKKRKKFYKKFKSFFK